MQFIAQKGCTIKIFYRIRIPDGPGKKIVTGL
jgi:hypothetical protein